MAALNFSAFGKPISASDPCGPDLDLEGDVAFMNCLAQADAVLPTQFFVQVGDANGKPRSVIFDRVDSGKGTEYDFPGQLKTVSRLLDRTRDVRLLSLAGRLTALNRDLHGCAACVAATARLLRDHWGDVHPRAESGDFGYRLGVLQALDDLSTMVLPLQHLTLFSNRRHGPISFRSYLVASGAAQAREDETAIAEREFERVLQDADPDDLAACRESVSLLNEAARTIAAVTGERVGVRDAVGLAQLIDLSAKMAQFLAPAGPAADAQATPGPTIEDDAIPAASAVRASGAAQAKGAGGEVANAPAARAALEAVSDYFRRHEPSSPAALLVRQAERLIGLPFQDVIRMLLPRYAEDATIYIGPKPEKSFQLNLERVAAGLGEAAAEDGEEVAKPVHFNVASRGGAVALLRQVAAFYRAHEPSSPIPLFTDRACSLINQDFLSILSDVLPGVRLARDND
ncbi:type VI secretion system ImpA family N-terminal domain-containing protein [Methylobacterium sp. 37f]|uniref:type VI secretion system protein TssA n=1 Tax=Methylobacterium sp. 37f TaxID=2817058 RepID=UPI001FFD96A5|nr:type VI secretion system ImpA family N-terminal domain-containing protein [Methylobacterium sp. 37f]MCK2056122.1 type VI secretion system ImpA family N-terminal domain-containing protein [Methylobacterium sp. 37f]